MLHGTPDKNSNLDSEHELAVLKYIMGQLNRFSDRPRVAAILQEMINSVSEKKLEPGSLRTHLSAIYTQEKDNRRHYSVLFYNALFSFLLLLTKYNPTNKRDEVTGELDCPISLGSIKATSRLLTTEGTHFDLESATNWFNSHETNPATGSILSERELDYLRSRLEDPSTAEIPHPKTLQIRRQSVFKKYMNYVRKDVGAAILYGIFPSVIIAISLMITLTFMMPPSTGVGFLFIDLAFFAIAFVIGAPIGICVWETCNNRQAPLPNPDRLRLSKEDRPHIPHDLSGKLLDNIQEFALQSRPYIKTEEAEEKSVHRSSYVEYSNQLAMTISIHNPADEDEYLLLPDKKQMEHTVFPMEFALMNKITPHTQLSTPPPDKPPTPSPHLVR